MGVSQLLLHRVEPVAQHIGAPALRSDPGLGFLQHSHRLLRQRDRRTAVRISRVHPPFRSFGALA
jgi:hypothetical protein